MAQIPRLAWPTRWGVPFLACLIATLADLSPASSQVGTVYSQQKISDTQGGFAGVFDNTDKLGRSVVALGDLDSDGVTDIAVGVRNDDDGSADRGAVYVLFMNADGTVKADQKISATAGGLTGPLATSDQFGCSVANIGDLDGDGVTDLAVGAFGTDDGGSNRGAVYVIFLNADGTVKAEQKISSTTGGLTGPIDDLDLFGGNLASVGDLDGDGAEDIAVGAVWDDDGGSARGAIWILFLNTDGTVKAEQKISDTVGGFTGVLDDDDSFGTSVTNLADLDGDGIVDIATGAPKDDDGGTNRGAAWILFLNTDGTVKAEQKISDTVGGFTGVLDDADYFAGGSQAEGADAIAGGVDIDGDGVEDLVVGATADDDGGTDRGAVWVLFLNTDGTVKAHQKISDTTGGFTGGLGDSDLFGEAIEFLGDLDGNGMQDLAVGAVYDDDGGSDRGAVYVLFMANPPKVSSVSPAENAIASTVGSDISATFSSASSGLSATTFVVHRSQSANRLSGVYAGDNTITHTFNPSGDLVPNEEIQVTLTGALQRVSNTENLAPPYVWRFTAAAGTGPALFTNANANFGTGTDNSRALTVGDVDGDGDSDVVVGKQTQQNVVYLNNGSGTLSTASNFGTGTDDTRGVVVGDVDSDGDLDVGVANWGQQNVVYLNDGAGSFTAGTKNFGTGTDNSREALLADLNGDGFLDTPTANWTQQNVAYLNDGSGSFTAGSLNFGTGSEDTYSMSAGDIDGDGDLDVATGNNIQQNVAYLNDGSGSLTAGTKNFGTGTDFTIVVNLADLDADGDLDVFVGNDSGQPDVVYLNDGSGNFTAGSNTVGGSDNTFGSDIGDVDGDGDLDIAVATGSAGGGSYQSKTYLNSGTATFGSSVDVGGNGDNSRAIALADLDGDQDLDIALANYGGQDIAYLNSGNLDGTLIPSSALDESAALPLPSTSNSLVAAADLLDFTIADGGAGDGLPLLIGKLVVHTSGTGPFDKAAWLLNGPDAANVSGVYSSGDNTITFSGLSISVADAGAETYAVRAYFTDTTGLTDGSTFSFTIDGDTDVITSGATSAMSGSNTAVSNAAPAEVGVTATRLVFATQPAPLELTSGLELDFGTDPVVSAQDASGNLDSDFTSTVTLTETGTGSGTFTNGAIAASSGVTTFTGLSLTFNAVDEQSIRLLASASAVTSDSSDVITVTAIPQLVTNTGGVLGEGGSLTLSSSLLRFSDAGGDGQVVFTVTRVPTAGGLKLGEVTLSSGSTFTQTDVSGGSVVYHHGGFEGQLDDFRFTVAGLAGVSTDEMSFGFKISATNDPPRIDVLGILRVDEGGLATITNGHLRILDDEDIGAHVTIEILSGPSHGYLSNTVISQALIDDQQLHYRHDGGEAAQDSFSFIARDTDGLITDPAVFRIAVVAWNDPFVVPSDPIVVQEGDSVQIDLAARDPEGEAIHLEAVRLPEGAVLNGTVLEWTPGFAQVGSHVLEIDYTDSALTVRARLDVRVEPDSGRASMPPAMDLGSPSVDFGVGHLDDTDVLKLVVTNLGGQELDVTGISSNLAHLTARPKSIRLSRESADTLTLSYSRSSMGRFEGYLLIESNDPVDSLRQIAVAGSTTWASTPRIEVETDSIQLGAVRVGSWDTGHVSVRNLGLGEMTIDASVEEEGFKASTTSIRLTTGASGTVIVILEPREYGHQGGTLRLVSNDPRRPTMLIGLYGFGGDVSESPIVP
ncbi:MAG: choice-of-anchor D domain-containing protein, partial [Gemmatimonadetes bacterium]|nr:choice-of-anchor D domain-containing protein [Gemmatimonadota bacterium]